MKIEITARLYKIEPPKQAKNGSSYYQKIVLLKVAPTNDLGEKIGQDQYYEVCGFSKTPVVTDPSLQKGDKVKATCYLNGKEEVSNNEIYYTLQLSLKDIVKL